ncbi:MAG TPA: FKBP-type peptidyl-prolyl cis-trans isomerase [Anaerolineae bacterium]|nr:FKBP-type peptidyl-prolyl cis-trans isomerase [Anaerolineae bacterium]
MLALLYLQSGGTSAGNLPAMSDKIPKVNGPVTTTPSGLQIVEVQPGTGKTAQSGSSVSVHYTGYLTDGTQFDSSIGGQPITFVLGSGRVIPGWEEGIAGMQVGEKRRLIIPPQLGYGAQGAGGVIPPNATLVFDVELVNIQ